MTRPTREEIKELCRQGRVKAASQGFAQTPPNPKHVKRLKELKEINRLNQQLGGQK